MTTKPPAGEKCPRCEGRKWIVLLVSRSTCPDCDGTGIAEKRPGKDEEGAGDEDAEDTGKWPLDPRV